MDLSAVKVNDRKKKAPEKLKKENLLMKKGN